MALHVNQKKLLKEEKEIGAASPSYYEGICMTCDFSPDREARAACPRADFFKINSYISKLGDVKSIKHLCKNWALASEILSCFKKNQTNTEATQIPPQNGFKKKFPKYK